jgi:hypothetical protein
VFCVCRMFSRDIVGCGSLPCVFISVYHVGLFTVYLIYVCSQIVSSVFFTVLRKVLISNFRTILQMANLSTRGSYRFFGNDTSRMGAPSRRRWSLTNLRKRITMPTLMGACTNQIDDMSVLFL